MFNDECTEGSGSVIWAERKETEEKKDCDYVGRVKGHNIGDDKGAVESP